MTEQQHHLQDVNILGIASLTSPAELKQDICLGEDVAEAVYQARETLKAILRGEDRRLIAIVGPCSIHNRDSAIEYAEKLSPLAAKVIDRIVVVMRVYFEKPRTTVGWKGLINDPHLDGTFDMSGGLRLAREILLDINQTGLPAATAPPNRLPIARWQAVCRCQLVLRTAPKGAWRWPSTRWRRHEQNTRF